MKHPITVRDGYLLTQLDGKPYLLPYGQNITAFRRGLQLNETSELLYRAITEGCDENELVQRLAAHYDAAAEELDTLRTDVSRFLSELRLTGVIDPVAPSLYVPCEQPAYVQIASVLMQLNLPRELIAEELLAFWADAPCAPSDVSLCVSARCGEPPERPCGQVLIHGSELLIMDCGDMYTMLFPASETLISCHLSADGTKACFYYKDGEPQVIHEELFHGIRFAFLYCAARHGLFAVHSASILYRQRAWLFSAPSGTGKSTHAALWNTAFRTPLLNGDLNLLGMENGAPVVYGLPWCGTSGIYTTAKHPLGGVIYLQQAKSDAVVTLTADSRQLMLAQRMISPTWTAEQLLACLSFCADAAPQIVSFLLQCTPDAHAAEVCKKMIDTLLETHLP